MTKRTDSTFDYEKCKHYNCVYLVDWHDFPDSTGYSKARQGQSWYGCMRYIALINNKRMKPCHWDEVVEQQLELFKAV